MVFCRKTMVGLSPCPFTSLEDLFEPVARLPSPYPLAAPITASLFIGAPFLAHEKFVIKEGEDYTRCVVRLCERCLPALLLRERARSRLSQDYLSLVLSLRPDNYASSSSGHPSLHLTPWDSEKGRLIGMCRTTTRFVSPRPFTSREDSQVSVI